MNAAPTREGPRVNELITARSVRVIDAEGENRGVLTIDDAIRLAEEAGLDLVEISPQVDPPVVKVMDFGKYKYELQKKKNEAKKKQKVIEIKEIKMRPNIDQHDYDVKMRSIHRFLADAYKGKVTLRFRGREMAHQDLGQALLERVRVDLEEEAKVEQHPKLEGRQMIMVIAPR